MYSAVQCWYARNASGEYGVFTCRGVACDYMGGPMALKHSLIRYDKECFTLEEGATLYRVEDDVGNGTNWYFSREEAERVKKTEYAEGDVHVLRGMLHVARISNIKFPTFAYLQYDRKGNLSCRMNAYPELDGNNTLGHVFFPDKSFTSATVGLAKISIVSSGPRFGFFKGEMWTEPKEFDDIQMLRWACRHLPADARLIPAFDKYGHSLRLLSLEDSTKYVYFIHERSLLGKANKGKYRYDLEVFQLRFLPDDIEIAKSYSLPWVAMFQLVSPVLDISSEVDLYKLYRESVFYSRDILGVKWERTDYTFGGLIDDALHLGVVQALKPCTGDQVVLTLGDELWRLGVYTKKQLEFLFSEMSRVNNDADSSFTGIIKRKDVG